MISCPGIQRDNLIFLLKLKAANPLLILNAPLCSIINIKFVADDLRVEDNDDNHDEQDIPVPPRRKKKAHAVVNGYPNIFMETEGGGQYKFTDKLILKDIKFDTDMPGKVKKGGIAIGLHVATKTTYKGHVLSDGDLIRSAVVFRLADKVISGVITVNQPVVGVLKQDHMGTVTDVTTDDLTDLEKEQMALKQAKMLLSSWDITKIQPMENPAIVITGNGEADA